MGRGRRKPRGKKINPTLYVYCEGETEESYINMLKRHYRLPSIIINPKVAGSRISNQYIRKRRKFQDRLEKDQDFLLYDLDVEIIARRIQEIKDVTLLVTNPCLELWFILHAKNQTKSNR